jgi:hypothetical protein
MDNAKVRKDLMVTIGVSTKLLSYIREYDKYWHWVRKSKDSPAKHLPPQLHLTIPVHDPAGLG